MFKNMEYIMLGTSEQIGVAERNNCTLMDMVICMTSKTNLQDWLRGEVLKTALYILDRILNNFPLKPLLNCVQEET